MSFEKCETLLTMLQLSDSTFPTGGFSHSLGCEAALQRCFVTDKKDMQVLLLSCLENAGSFNVPFVRKAFDCYHNLEEIIFLDHLYDASLTNHIAKRASIQQGKSLLWSSLKTFEEQSMVTMQSYVEQGKINGHQVILFGYVCSVLGLPKHHSLEMYLFSTLRTAVASIVRIGKHVGPIEAQNLQYEIQKCLPDIIERYKEVEPEDAFITAPLIDIFQNSHDILFRKLFYS